MADKKIQIGIKTTADTSGAKAAEQSLKDVAAAGKEAQQAEPTGFGRDTAAAKRIAILESEEAAMEKAALAAKEAADQTKTLAETLPELTEADLAAEAVERLGDAAADTGGANGGGLGEMVKGLIGGGIALMGYQKLLEFGIQRFMAWRQAFEDWAAAADARSDELNRLASESAELEVQQRAAVEAAAALAAAQHQITAAAQATGDELGKYTDRLQETIEKEQELRRLRDEIAGKKADLALEQAEGDPAKQAEIREQERKRQQEQARKDLEADIAANRKIREQAAAELPGLEETEGIARERKGGFEASAAANRQEQQRMERIAKQAEEQRKASAEAQQEAEKNLENFWTPTVIKNQSRETIFREQDRQAELEQTAADARARAAAAENAAKLDDTQAAAEQTKADNARKLAEERRRAYEQASKEEERLSGTVKPFIEESQSLDDQRADAREQNRRRAEQQKNEEIARKKSEQERREAERETREIDRESRGIPGAVEDATRGGAPSARVTRDVEEAAAKLKDGATADEFSGLAAALGSFADASQSIGAKRRAEIQALSKTVADMAERLRKVEGK